MWIIFFYYYDNNINFNIDFYKFYEKINEYFLKFSNTLIIKIFKNKDNSLKYINIIQYILNGKIIYSNNKYKKNIEDDNIKNIVENLKEYFNETNNIENYNKCEEILKKIGVDNYDYFKKFKQLLSKCIIINNDYSYDLHNIYCEDYKIYNNIINQMKDILNTNIVIKDSKIKEKKNHKYIDLTSTHKHILNILINILYKKNDIIIFDEILDCIHSQEKKNVFNKLFELAKHKQYFFITHNSDFLSINNINMILYIKNIETKHLIFHYNDILLDYLDDDCIKCIKNKINENIKNDENKIRTNNIQKIRRYLKNNFSLIDNIILNEKANLNDLLYENKNIFFNNKIICVEGKTDEKLVKVILENNKCNTFVIPVYSKTSKLPIIFY